MSFTSIPAIFRMDFGYSTSGMQRMHPLSTLFRSMYYWIILNWLVPAITSKDSKIYSKWVENALCNRIFRHNFLVIAIGNPVTDIFTINKEAKLNIHENKSYWLPYCFVIWPPFVVKRTPSSRRELELNPFFEWSSYGGKLGIKLHLESRQNHWTLSIWHGIKLESLS